MCVYVCTVGMALAAASQDKEMEKAMLGHLRAVSISSSKILLSAKTLGADPSAPNALNQLSAAARYVHVYVLCVHTVVVAFCVYDHMYVIV